MNEYFNYFTEIEQRFCQRRGTMVLCSSLDWALMETWKDAGIPLEAVLRGIDAAFDRYDARPNKTRKVNSLTYCAQEVLAAAEEMQESAIGANREQKATGLEAPDVSAFLRRNAEELQRLLSASETGRPPIPASAAPAVEQATHTLANLASGLEASAGTLLEDVERRLTVLEEKIMAALLAAQSEDELVKVRADADRELAPYRSKMAAVQIEQLIKQFVHKRLLERYRVPRLSLFYM